jgi:regulator of replication initiation timing
MSIIENIKSIANILQKADNIELYRKILDLQTDAMELVEQNYELKNEVRELKNKLSFRGNLIHRNNKYWKLNDQGDEDGPFCTTCWDVKELLVRLHILNNGYVTCHNCGMTSEDEQYTGSRIYRMEIE